MRARKEEKKMRNFIKDHPIFTLLIVATICDTAIAITRLVTHQPLVEIKVAEKVKETAGK